ncbi:heavy metal-associated domain-containing protein, partial [Peribacillus sp. SIMBA_075]
MNEKKEANLQISGMTCAACANRIEKGLKKVEGVHDANVNFALEKTKIMYDPHKTNPQQFKEKVESLGYGIVSDKAEFTVSG